MILFRVIFCLILQTVDVWSEPFSFNLVTPEAELSAKQITELLYRAKKEAPLNLTGLDLTYLDLSNLDFKKARLSHADLYGTDFTDANLKEADLSSTRLDRAVLIRTNFSYANLEAATIFRPTIYSDLSTKLGDAPLFIGANLKRIKVQAELSGANFRGADLSEADFHPLEDRPGQGTLVTLRRNVLKSCDFTAARLVHANFSESVLTFSKMTDADLSGANFKDADLSKVDFRSANLSGANLSGADVDGANFIGSRGIETVIGLEKVKNLDKSIR